MGERRRERGGGGEEEGEGRLERWKVLRWGAAPEGAVALLPPALHPVPSALRERSFSKIRHGLVILT